MEYDQHIEYEWDQAKALIYLCNARIANFKKHGVSFDEAKTVFENPLAVIFDDEMHSIDEYREIIIGHSQQNRLLLIAFTERSGCIRIISARLATRTERNDYEQHTL